VAAPAEARALMERQAFLARVRSALHGAERPELPAAFPRTPASGDGAGRGDPERFQAALAANNGLARIVRIEELADAVADVAGGMGQGRRVVVAGDVAPWWLEIERGLARAGAEIVRPGSVTWREEAARADLGITSAALAIASTGSLLLTPGADAPRVASLLPTVHLAILPTERVVPGLEEALEEVALAIHRSSAPVLVTGPSRTSDIEMTTVYGVHGPRSVHVLLVA
jgi:L-lactate utilization protein LutC